MERILYRCIFKVTCTINGKIYIGKQTHKNRKGRGHPGQYLGSGVVIARAIKKYGYKNFTKEILEDGFWHQFHVNERERYWIKWHREQNFIVYNIAPGGEWGDSISQHPERDRIIQQVKDTRKARKANGRIYKVNKVFGTSNVFSSENRKRWETPVHKEKQRNIGRQNGKLSKGRKMSKETKLKLSVIASKRTGEKNSFYGRTHTKESIELMKIGNRGKIAPNRRTIIIDGQKYNCLNDAHIALKIPAVTIHYRCHSKNKKFANYQIL